MSGRGDWAARDADQLVEQADRGGRPQCERCPAVLAPSAARACSLDEAERSAERRRRQSSQATHDPFAEEIANRRCWVRCSG